jgi:hypothetical protein
VGGTLADAPCSVAYEAAIKGCFSLPAIGTKPFLLVQCLSFDFPSMLSARPITSSLARTGEICTLAAILRKFAVGIVICSGLQSSPTALAQSSTAQRKLIAMEYEVWFPGIDPAKPDLWQQRWGTPILGRYNSSDRRVIDKHVEWFNQLGVDIVLIDWTNSSANYVAGNRAVDHNTRANTDALFAEYDRLARMDRPHPKIAVIVGAQDEGPIKQYQVREAVQDEVNYIYTHYVQAYPHLYATWDGKPLLPLYIGVNDDPGWRDARFTTRIMSVWLERLPSRAHWWARQHDATNNSWWSWYDRKPVPSHNRGNEIETVTVTSAFPGATGWADTSGAYPASGRSQRVLSAQWEQAVSANPKMIIINQWNEFQGGSGPTDDQYSIDLSNDLEPSQELGCGPMTMLQQAIAAWKRVTLPGINCSAD